MVSSQTVAARERFPQEQKQQCQSDSNGNWGATLQQRSHGVTELPYHCLYMYLSGRTTSLRTVNSHHFDDTFNSVHSLPTPTRAVLLIIRGLSGQTVSFPQSQDRRTKVRPSGKQLLGYVPVWLPNPVAAVQPSVAALLHSLRRELAVLVYLVKRIEGG